MAINRHIKHIKSQVVENGAPKLPTSSQIELGEIAINYAKGYETIAIKNASGDIVTFSSDKKTQMMKGTTPQGHTLADAGDSYYTNQLAVGEAGLWAITYSDGGMIFIVPTDNDENGRIKLHSDWRSRLGYSDATWANVGDLLLVYRYSLLITVYKILTLNEAGETRVGIMSPTDKQRVNRIPTIEGELNNKLPLVTSDVNIGNVNNGAYASVTAGRTNWIDSSGGGAAISLGNLQIAVDPSGRLYSRNKNNGIWNLTNQLRTVDITDCNEMVFPCVVGWAVLTNGPTSNGHHFTVYVISSSDYDGNGYRSLLQIAIDRDNSDVYMRTIFKQITGVNFLWTDWKKLNYEGDIEDLNSQMETVAAALNNLDTELTKKVDKVVSPTNGNLASLDSSGNLADSGKKVSDFVTKSNTYVNQGKGYISGSEITLVNSASTATTANKLNANAGSATQPVYFSNGIPSACTYSFETTLSSSNTKVPTSQAVTNAISSAMASALTYKGAISAATTLSQSHKVGDLYVVASAGTYAGYACEVGDYLIAKTSGTSATSDDWDAINGENQVENKAASLASPGSTITAATVDGTNITLTTPSSWKVTDENTWRPVKLGNIEILNSSTTSGSLGFSGSTRVSITNNNGTLEFDANITKSDVGLDNVGNFKAVSTVANQGLSTTEKSNARANIGAGTSSVVVGTSSGNAADGAIANSHYINTSNPHGVTKTQVGLSAVTNDAQVKRSEMGVANGVATLNSSGKVPTSQLDISVSQGILTVFGATIPFYDYISSSTEKGKANGVASLDSSGKVPSSQLPADSDTKYKFTLNGTTNGTSTGTSLGTAYAPTTVGSNGQVLKSNGSGAPSWIDDTSIKGIIETTYSNLVSLRNSSGLTSGQWYRITDYVTTTVQEETRSAGHQFDVIVRADSTSTLNENAYAALHSGDTYFSNKGAQLNAWKLKYCLTDDTFRFNWTDSTNGKGVIYYMKDEWGNECGYDFKNIQFKRYSPSGYSQQALKGLDGTVYPQGVSITTATTSVWCYTFNTANGDASLLNGDDTTLCYNNIIPLYYDEEDEIFYLNNIVFNTMVTSNSACFNNRFGFDCRDSTFRNNANNNIIGNMFQGNIIVDFFRINVIGNFFEGNTIGGTYFQYNIVGNGFAQNNVLGNYIVHNTFGNYVSNNSFTGRLYYSSIGNYCRYLNINKSYVYNLNIEDGNQYITLTSTQTTSASNKLQNIHIARGVNNSTTMKTISHNTVNDAFGTTYQSSNSQTINI